MESTLRIVEQRVPPPQRVPMLNSFVFRYVERTIHQALVQKLARLVSGLHAASLLLAAGFVQEQAALQRMLDEFQDDIVFLAFGVINNDVSALHREYLDAFYQEDFADPANPARSLQSRKMIPRKRIHAYLARLEGQGIDPHTAGTTFKTIGKTYSGFVHAASPQVMEMYGGETPRFHVTGMRDTPRFEDHSHDLWNYFYRGICAFGIAAKAFGDDAVFTRIKAFRDHFEASSGRARFV